MNDQSRYIVDSRYFDGTCLTFMTDGFRSDFGGETLEEMHEPWCTEEKEIICELMQKTNHLSIFIECLQRTGQAIQIQIEGKNN